MKEMSSEVLSDLTARTRAIVEYTEKVLMNSSENLLKQRISDDKWNVLECLHHLNLYSDFYLPVFEREINMSRINGSKPRQYFSSGPIGKFFYQSMLPKDGKIKPMSTFKDKNPVGMELPENVTEEFLNNQRQFLEILKQAALVDLEKTRIPVTITRFVRLKLGDALRFNIYHNERHVNQAKVIVDQVMVDLGVVK
jgi:hypothetical protein